VEEFIVETLLEAERSLLSVPDILANSFGGGFVGSNIPFSSPPSLDVAGRLLWPNPFTPRTPPKCPLLCSTLPASGQGWLVLFVSGGIRFCRYILHACPFNCSFDIWLHRLSRFHHPHRHCPPQLQTKMGTGSPSPYPVAGFYHLEFASTDIKRVRS